MSGEWGIMHRFYLYSMRYLICRGYKMEADQRSLMRDERGGVSIPVVLLIIGIGFMVTGSIFVVLDHVLVTPIQEVINTPNDSSWSDSLVFSAIGWFCIVLGIIFIIMSGVLMWRGNSSI